MRWLDCHHRCNGHDFEQTPGDSEGQGSLVCCSPSGCKESNLTEQLKVKVKVTQSCPTLCDPMDCPWNSPGQNTGLGSLSLLQGMFPTQGLNPGFLHCRWILYQLNHKGSPRILEWVAYPFSSGTSRPRNRTGVSYFACRIFTN